MKTLTNLKSAPRPVTADASYMDSNIDFKTVTYMSYSYGQFHRSPSIVLFLTQEKFCRIPYVKKAALLQTKIA